MAEFQKVGDEQRLSKGPRNYNRSQFASGKYQKVGDEIKLSTKPVAGQSGVKNIRGGSYQKVGDSVSLNRSAQKGWNSYSTPMSERAVEQSALPGIAKGKKGRKK